MSEYSVEKKGRLLTLIRFHDSIKRSPISLKSSMYVLQNKRWKESLFPIEWLFGPGTLFKKRNKHIIFVAVHFYLYKTIDISYFIKKEKNEKNVRKSCK